VVLGPKLFTIKKFSFSRDLVLFLCIFTIQNRRLNSDGMGQDGTCEALISINHQLDLPEAAAGILYCAQNFHHIELKESWYEKLKRWETALQIYESKQVLRIGRDEDWDGFF